MGRNSMIHPMFMTDVRAKVPQKSSMMLMPCFRNPIYISPAPGISDAINTKKPCFCFVISILLLLICYWGSPPDSLQFYQNPAKYHFPEPGKTFPDRTDGPAYTAP